jgi:hypothetical protein
MSILIPTITIPLTAEDQQFVKRIVVQSRCPQPRLKQLIQNLLAVRAVSHWLDIYGIAYEWQKSDCVNPLIHLGEEVADLYLSGLGRLECRAIKNGSQTLHIPAETWQNRLGYLFVEISDDLRAGQIVGFLDSVQTERVARRALQPIDTLFEVLALAESRAKAIIPEAIPTALNAVTSAIQKWVTTAQANVWEIGDLFCLEPSFAPTRGSSTLKKIITKLQQATSDSSQQRLIVTLKEFFSLEPSLVATRGASTVNKVITKLQAATSDPEQQRLIITLGELAQEENLGLVINELVTIINKTNNEDTRWLAAGTLARLDPSHPLAAHCLKKIIGTNLKLVGTPLELIISLMPNQQHQIAGIVELRSVTPGQCLPPGLSLGLWTTTDKLIDQIVVTQQLAQSPNILKTTLVIQPGTDFRVKVSLDDFQVTEDIQL